MPTELYGIVLSGSPTPENPETPLLLSLTLERSFACQSAQRAIIARCLGYALIILNLLVHMKANTIRTEPVIKRL